MINLHQKSIPCHRIRFSRWILDRCCVDENVEKGDAMYHPQQLPHPLPKDFGIDQNDISIPIIIIERWCHTHNCYFSPPPKKKKKLAISLGFTNGNLQTEVSCLKIADIVAFLALSWSQFASNTLILGTWTKCFTWWDWSNVEHVIVKQESRLWSDSKIQTRSDQLLLSDSNMLQTIVKCNFPDVQLTNLQVVNSPLAIRRSILELVVIRAGAFLRVWTNAQRRNDKLIFLFTKIPITFDTCVHVRVCVYMCVVNTDLTSKLSLGCVDAKKKALEWRIKIVPVMSSIYRCIL